MGRERIKLKKIEKVRARHVTSSKRRKGLIKKAKEVSVLCDADVGLITFSATGRLFEYSTSRHMDGEDLQELTMQELQEMEQKLEVGLHRIRSTKWNQIEEENAYRFHLELKQRFNLDNNTAVEPLLIEPVETRDHPQSSESSTHNSCTSTRQHKKSIQHDEASDISLQLGLSI